MLEKFNSYYQKNQLFNKTDKILLTISGGKDSMAMLNLFQQNNLSFGIAHCNFQLRGDAAVKDEEFVAAYAKINKIDYYRVAFDTQEYATEKGISIQMAARELRYNWFEKIRNENNYQYIATAHHKNDVAETMLINLSKGTGLAGLHGIKNKSEKIIRPMLCFSSIEIDIYAKKNKVSYREDLSNADVKYTRNLIRHHVIPALEKINPALIETLNIEASQFQNDEKIIEDRITAVKNRLFIQEGEVIKIATRELKKLTPLKSYLYYFFRDYGFNSLIVENVIDSLDSHSGKTFLSLTHQIVKDREFLLLKKIEENLIETIEIKSQDDFPFDVQLINVTDNIKIEKSTRNAYLDVDKVRFPLTLRTWQQGDVFQPFGMDGRKKVSDFLIDKKVSLIDKKRVKVLESNGQILWLVGQRIDDKFKITSLTKKVLVLSVKD